MSLILDALKRAERERKADAVPAPGEVAVPATGRARRRLPRALMAAGIAAGVVAAGALAWMLLLRDGTPAQPPPTAIAEPQPQAPAIKARPAPPGSSFETPAVVPGTESVASLDDLTDEALADGEPPVPVPVPTPAPAPTPAPPEPELQAQPEAEAPGAAAPSEPAAPASAPQEIPPALTQPAPLRKFREMPPDYRADFPALKVEIHVYEKAVQKRFVMVNGRRYRQGERLSEGPQLVEIVPEGMVLEFRGEKILYPLNR